MNKNEIVKTLMTAEKQCGLIDTLYRVFGKSIRVNIEFSKETCDSSIEELVLSVRSYNALRRANITTVGDLIEQINEGGLKNIRNLGVKSFSEIQTKLLVFGFERLSEKRRVEFFRFLCNNNILNLYK